MPVSLILGGTDAPAASSGLTILALIVGSLFLAAVRAGFRRVESAIRDLDESFGKILAGQSRDAGVGLPLRDPFVEASVPGPEHGSPGTERSLPEGWNKSELVWTDETIRKLRQWLVEHPGEARVWRIANPSGFRLWAEALGAPVIRQIWPEEFPPNRGPRVRTRAS